MLAIGILQISSHGLVIDSRMGTAIDPISHFTCSSFPYPVVSTVLLLSWKWHIPLLKFSDRLLIFWRLDQQIQGIDASHFLSPVN
jgi:hypothetical protein